MGGENERDEKKKETSIILPQTKKKQDIWGSHVQLEKSGISFKVRGGGGGGGD